MLCYLMAQQHHRQSGPRRCSCRHVVHSTRYRRSWQVSECPSGTDVHTPLQERTPPTACSQPVSQRHPPTHKHSCCHHRRSKNRQCNEASTASRTRDAACAPCANASASFPCAVVPHIMMLHPAANEQALRGGHSVVRTQCNQCRLRTLIFLNEGTTVWTVLPNL